MADGTTITIEAQDTSFQRAGVTTQDISYVGGVNPTISPVIPSFISIIKPSFTPTARLALDSLATIYGLGPLDTTFETSTNALYTRSYAIARAAAQSGPVNVRGGTARIGFELAELDTQMSISRYKEVWQHQIEWAKVVEEAISIANTIISEYDKEVLSNNEQSVMAQHAN